jgi:hypothetical protein
VAAQLVVTFCDRSWSWLTRADPPIGAAILYARWLPALHPKGRYVLAVPRAAVTADDVATGRLPAAGGNASWPAM